MLRKLESVDWRVFGILFVAGLLGVIAILPFAIDLFASVPLGGGTPPEMSLPLTLLLALLQNGILLAVAIIVGMILSQRIGLEMPFIRGWATGEGRPRRPGIVQAGILVGAGVGVVLVGVEAIFFLPHLPDAMLPLFEIPLWKRLLAGIVYGGITEELFMRLFLLSLVAWLAGTWWRTEEGMPTTGAFWTAIVVVAVLFGLGHLPATAAIVPLTQSLVARALVLNGVAGAAFGYLYWRHGLEAAMLGHMSAHLVMQVPGFMLLRGML